MPRSSTRSPIPATPAAAAATTVADVDVSPVFSAAAQGLTLVHVRAQLKQLQDTFMSELGLYGGESSLKLS
jgi:hypothetical protein